MTPGFSMLRKRLAGLLLILPLILGLCVAAYKLGPNPARPVEQVATDSPAAPAARKAELSQAPNSQLFELFGMYQTAIGRGRVQVTPAEYLNSLEALYRQRGYRKIEGYEPQSITKRKPGKRVRKKPVAIKFFQRDETDGIANISATGADADYNSDQQASEPYTFSTLVVTTGNGGADWATYRLGIDRNKLAQLESLEYGDFPGTDPRSVPRLPGLQRIYALTSPNGSMAIYKSKEAETSLMVHYLDEMPRYGWRLAPDAVPNANDVRGVMPFTKGARFCMIWITTNKGTGTTNITISSQ